MVVMGASVAVIEDDAILLTLREDFEVWCLPGGEIDEGESLAECARREVREEIGLEVELTRLVGCYSRIGWRPRHSLVFAGQISGGTWTLDPREVLEARFFPFDALPDADHLLLGQYQRILDAISGVCGTVKTEYVPIAGTSALSRAEIYAMRDQSGLSRREFYLRTIPPLMPEQIKTEVRGCND